jgi:hypothetical protein
MTIEYEYQRRYKGFDYSKRKRIVMLSVAKHLIYRKLRVQILPLHSVQGQNDRNTPALKSQLGISMHEGGTYPQHPIPPSELVAELLEGGNIELDWSRNGIAPVLFSFKKRINEEKK